MKITFINPILGGDFSAMDIGITGLATYINKRTPHRASICDLTFHRRNWRAHIQQHMARFKPDIVGISATSLYLPYVERVASEVKRAYGLPVIIGGYEASTHPDKCIKLEGVDYVCIGDGEKALSLLLDSLKEQGDAGGISGIWARKGRRIIKNKVGCFREDIDGLPIPDWELWEDLDKYLYYIGAIYFVGTRGCPYSCIYCDAHQVRDSVEGKYYRVRDPEQYAREIIHQWKRYEKRGMRFAQLFDQVPTMEIGWLKRFCREYISKGDPSRYKFSMFSRIDHLDEEKIRLLSSAGCSVIRLGVEAGDEFIRNGIYNKNIGQENIARIFGLCKKYKIAITAFYMIGGPAETSKTIEATINLACGLDAERSAFFVFKPVTDESVRLILKYGGKIEERANADNFTFGAVVRLKDLSTSQIEGLQYKAYLRTLPRRLLRLLMLHPLAYIPRLLIYLVRGAIDGLDVRYLLTYHHIYAYDYANI